MKYTEKLDIILTVLAEELNISPTMFERAEQSYTALGEHVKNANENWDVEVYPQGSFAIGTVVKPLSDDDQYDVDLVILIKTPALEAKILRDSIIRILESYGKYEGKIESKKRCIRIQYSESSQFHMDLACAKAADRNGNEVILIAQCVNDIDYNFSLSNPLGYIEWFKSSMRYSELPRSIRLYEGATEVKPLPLVKIHTSLQQAIQLLKRHRDIYFEHDNANRPSSIIITTLCALSYDYIVRSNFKSDSVYETIKAMLGNLNHFIVLKNDGYHLDNPVMQNGENFLTSWKDDPSLKSSFDSWITQAKKDIITDPASFIETNPEKLRESFNLRFGKNISDRALKRYGDLIGKINSAGAFNMDKDSMSLTLKQSGESIVQPQKNTFFGD